MEVTYFYWAFMVAIGLFIGMRASVKSWRPIVRLGIMAFVFIGVAVVFGLHEGLESFSLAKLLSDDRTYWLRFSSAFHIVGVGFCFVVASAILCIRKLLQSNMPSAKADNFLK